MTLFYPTSFMRFMGTEWNQDSHSQEIATKG
jgi:hypothetical protein